MKPEKDSFARQWVASWNSRDINAILKHYSDDVEVTSPMIKVALGIAAGTLIGKENVKEYWMAALSKIPDLKFELIDVAESVDSITIYYRSVMNMQAMEVMFFDESGLVNKVIAHYR